MCLYGFENCVCESLHGYYDDDQVQKEIRRREKERETMEISVYFRFSLLFSFSDVCV